jgi:hypothetical protein
VKTGADLGGATGVLLEEGASQLVRYSNTLDGAGLASDMSKRGGALNTAAPIVGAGAALVVLKQKCTPEKGVTAECAQAGLSFGSSAASSLDLIPGGPAGPVPAVTPLANGAYVLDVASNAVGAYNSCFANQSDDWVQHAAECVQGLADTGVSYGSNAGAPGRAISATYTLAKVNAPAIVDRGGTYVLGKSPGEWLYDRFKAADEEARIAAQSSPASLEQIRIRRRAAYAAAAGELMSKQETYDAAQRKLEMERQAAMSGQNHRSSDGQNILQGLMSAVPGLQQSSAPRGGSGADWSGVDAAIRGSPGCKIYEPCSPTYHWFHPGAPSSSSSQSSASSKPPPPSNGDCGGTGPGTCR